MTVILLVVLLSLLIGKLRGGSLDRLATLHLAGWWLVFVAVAVQALGAFAGELGLSSPQTVYVVGMLGSAALITVFVLRNRFVPGMLLIAAGFILNATVVAANGAMPVDLGAADEAGISLSHIYAGADAKHEVRTDDTRLAFLSDVIAVPLPLPTGSNVVSVGDIVLAAGIGVLVVRGMLRRRRPQGPQGVLARAGLSPS